MIERVEALRGYAEGSTVDERLADEVIAGLGGEWSRLQGLILRAVRTAMLIELIDLALVGAADIDWDAELAGLERST